MSAKRDYNASITTKGLDKTGMTEDITRKLYSRRGRKCMGIVEFVVDETSDKRDGTHKVNLAIAGLEVLLDSADFEEHIREIMRTLAYNRAVDDGQLQIPGDGINPKVSDVIAAGAGHRPHPFLPVDAADDNPICDVCGVVFPAGPHTSEGFLPTEGDYDDPDSDGTDDEPDHPTDDDTEHDPSAVGRAELEADEDPDVDALTDEPTEVDLYAYTHAKGGNLPGEETVCALHATIGKNLHTHDDHTQVTCPDCLEQLAIDATFEQPHQAGPEPTVAEVTAAQRHLASVADPFTTPTT